VNWSHFPTSGSRLWKIAIAATTNNEARFEQIKKKRRSEMRMKIRKLRCVIPEQLFLELRDLQLLPDIDSIVTELLNERVEEIKENRRYQR